MYDFTLVVLDGCYGTGVAVSLDILRAACAMAPRTGVPVPRWRVCSPNGGLIRLQSGLLVETARLPARRGDDDSTWIVPGLGLNTEAEVQACLGRDDVQQAIRALRRHVRAGGKVAAGCSSVFLLEFAGLLQDRRVTTTWWLAPLLQRMNPQCRVDAERMVCADGQIVSAGAAFAQTDLMLHVLRETCGATLVDALSRFLLADSREAQSRYVIPEVLANGDELVAHIVARIEKGLPRMPTVAELARDLGVSERTLARRVRRATGRSPLALLQSVRLRKARRLLEQSRMSVEDIAYAVGYGDSTALRRLMRRNAGVSPRQYRPSVAVAENARYKS